MEITSHPRRKTGRPRSFDRDKALHKAMLTFWRYGYETTSLNDLTAAMGVTAPSIYTAYGDKKQLFLEAVKLYAGSLDALERSLFNAPTSRQAALDMLSNAATAFTGDATPRGCLLASATASGSRDSADVQAAVADIRREIQARLSKRIRKDITDGILSEGTDDKSLAAMVIALISGMSVVARDGADRSTLVSLSKMAMMGWPCEDAASSN